MESSANRVGKPRSPLFRALGKSDPPATIEIRGETFHRDEIYKHDSWAASGTYRGPSGTVFCKFNRQQSVLGFPMKWLGRLLGKRETFFLKRLADLPGIPRWSGPIVLDGRELKNAVAHEYVKGRPLAKSDNLPREFFDGLEELLRQMHQRGIAYVDLHKRENILVGDDQQPYLLDFQISLRVPKIVRKLPVLRLLFEFFRDSDLYHLQKHRHRNGDEAVRADTAEWKRPLIIRMHRMIARPFRAVRRRLLVTLGFRTGRGLARSEFFSEHAVRLETKKAA